MKELNLTEAPSGAELEVLEINAGVVAKKRLISMGIHPGNRIIKFNDSSWGPILIKNITLNSTKLAIGRRLAWKIQVRYDS